MGREERRRETNATINGKGGVNWEGIGGNKTILAINDDWVAIETSDGEKGKGRRKESSGKETERK